MTIWKYNRFGHIEIWHGEDMEGEADEYIQVDYEVEAFLNDLGRSSEDMGIDDWDYFEEN